ncbi:4'-phosphopantetheinyl transferase superfamily protein [Streptococcus sp.]|uniref:4'-phosphopantetheinyl transferase superfamily protein n=1 Tax=Streptococcus sp. TaxID=1306 RepID=UPI00025AC405|nr:4'-phosphopantetheinyl transferase superfamily protein [Streptococcus sp.]EID20892.1 hypothetical protein HMPREF1045_1761 [Streptococcus mitis SK616]MDN3290706.1 4'-phosphopantetheinyl transferase superfamily protein [Streptococcus sp.]
MIKNNKIIFLKNSFIENFPNNIKRKILKKIAKEVLETELRKIGRGYTDIIIDENGKKKLRNSSYYFSISYSGNAIVIVFSDHNVGIDIEQNRNINIDNLKNFFDDKIIRNIDSSDDSIYEFLKYWVVAESFGKYEGCGILELTGKNFLNPNITIKKGLNISLNEEVIFRILEMENFIISICSKEIQRFQIYSIVI